MKHSLAFGILFSFLLFSFINASSGVQKGSFVELVQSASQYSIELFDGNTGKSYSTTYNGDPIFGSFIPHSHLNLATAIYQNAYYVIFDKILYTVDPVTCNLTSPIPLPFYVITPVIVSSNHLSSVGIGSMIDVWFDEDGYVASFVTPVPFDVDNRFDWQEDEVTGTPYVYIYASNSFFLGARDETNRSDITWTQTTFNVPQFSFGFSLDTNYEEEYKGPLMCICSGGFGTWNPACYSPINTTTVWSGPGFSMAISANQFSNPYYFPSLSNQTINSKV